MVGRKCHAPETPSGDLFRSSLEAILYAEPELLVLADKIDWDRFDEAFGAHFDEHKGRAGLPIRLMAGLHLLKHMKGLSDEELCAVWIENPYFQAFCGETHFQHRAPFDRSSMTREASAGRGEGRGTASGRDHPNGARDRCGERASTQPGHGRRHRAGPKLLAAVSAFGEWAIGVVRRSDTATGFEVLPRRWVVERTFAWLGRCRRLAKDLERTIESSTAWTFIASIRLMTRRLTRHCYL